MINVKRGECFCGEKILLSWSKINAITMPNAFAGDESGQNGELVVQHHKIGVRREI